MLSTMIQDLDILTQEKDRLQDQYLVVDSEMINLEDLYDETGDTSLLERLSRLGLKRNELEDMLIHVDYDIEELVEKIEQHLDSVYEADKEFARIKLSRLDY